MPVTYRLIACAALCFFGTVSGGLAADPLSYSYDRSTGGRPASTVPNDNTSGVLPPVATGRKNSGVQEGRSPIYPTNPLKRYHLPTALNYPSNPLNYPSTPSNYPSTASNYPSTPLNYPSTPLNYASNPLNYPSNQSRLRTRNIDPANASAQLQSGLNQADATSLMRTQGYTQIGEVRPDPNSIWLWQADAMKNGRRVQLGIDNRGNLSDLSAGQNQPCTIPGVGLGAGAGPMGVGSRLSGVTSCR
jgi:hypothetical protein